MNGWTSPVEKLFIYRSSPAKPKLLVFSRSCRIFVTTHLIPEFLWKIFVPGFFRAQLTRSNTGIHGANEKTWLPPSDWKALRPGTDAMWAEVSVDANTVVDLSIPAGSCWATQHPSTAVIKHNLQVYTLTHSHTYTHALIAGGRPPTHYRPN